MNDLKIIAKCLGGSKSYGIDTPQSDEDIRFIFLNTKMETTIGLQKHEHQINKNEVDNQGFEFRHALNLLQRGNTQVAEMLWNDDWIEISDEWLEVQKYKKELLDSDKLFNCLRGYFYHELRKFLGIGKCGTLGSKRKNSIEDHGFSEKNAVQALRLLWCGKMYFNFGFFPVSVRKYDIELADLLVDIKTNPKTYTTKILETLTLEYEKQMISAYEKKLFKTTYNFELANKLCLKNYFPIVQKLYENL